MRLPRVRFTVRRMMVAVAVAALLAGGGLEVRRLWLLSTGYAAEAAKLRTMRDTPIGYAPPSDPAQFRADMERMGRRRKQLDRDIATYERAARRPWLPVAPDPPGPE